jgi:uncharacterized protein YyaL (SSP411 family)
MPNRLAEEQSPYLLQHKDNPVEWYPWGDEAFARARVQDKPIFLSIGYSTCHWCHVMERESFENHEVAEVLNRHFVSIKVDREERPDVDRVYMTFVQATTGSGGWPMSVWLTPSLQPFYGGTYFPPTSRWGRPGFVDVLVEIARVWREERDRVEQSASTIIERLRSLRAGQTIAALPGVDVLENAAREFGSMFDARRGGFGDAPKFPRPSELLFLMREHARTGAEAPRDMALLTLRAMAIGGMRDHIGGGFHRYSVDGDWRVPHFEKMLYDQAQLVLAYLEAAQISGDAFYANVAIDTLEYVRRDMIDASGAFYSAEDADSVPPEEAEAARTGTKVEKKEGAFYVWSDDEIGAALGEDAEVFRLRYGVRPDGNAPADPQGEFTGKNLLYTARPIDNIAAETGRSPVDVVAALDRARATLLRLRAQRPRPHLDDKVLTAWNGLMIAAFARAARVLPEGSIYAADARRAATFLRDRLWQPATQTLLRRYRDGDAGVEGYAEDYAYLIFGLIELFEADGDPSWLDWALTLQQRQDDLFWDEMDGGWFSTTGKDASVLLRLKEDYDGAEPAASSMSVMNLLTLQHLFPDRGFDQRIERTLGVFAARLAGHSGRAVPMMLAAISTYHQGMPQLVLAGDPSDPIMQAMQVEVRRRYRPTLIVVPAWREFRTALADLLPWTTSMTEEAGARAFLCHEFVCQAPVSSAPDLARELGV